MEKIDLSTNSRQIQDLYDRLVRGEPSTAFVVYAVDRGTLQVAEHGDGDLAEFVSHFGDGRVLFGLARVTVPGSDVSKVLLVGWCPDNAPAKSRVLFAANYAEVSKVLAGYHVQVTARDADDLDVDDLVLRVGAAAGARYSVRASPSVASPSVAKPATPVTKPATPVTKPATPVTKPAKPVPKPAASFVPRSTGKPTGPTAPAGVPADDGWNGQAEIEERDFAQNPLLDLPSAYTPTKVDIVQLRKGKSDTVSSKPVPSKPAVPSVTERMAALPISSPSDGRTDGRLTSLPKPKVSHSVAHRFAANVATSAATPSAATPSATGPPAFGAKPLVPLNAASPHVVGGLLRNFGSENGKTPAQIWAEKRGHYKVVAAAEQVGAENEGQGNDEDDEDEEDEEDALERFQAQPQSAQQLEQEDDIEQQQQQQLEAQVEEQERQNEIAADSDPEKPHSQSPPPVQLPARNLPPPPVQLPARNLPPPPVQLPARNLPPPPVQLPARNLPPPPVRNVAPELAPAPATPASTAPPAGPSAIAEYDYEKDEDNEVGFAEGDRIVDIAFVDDEWWLGTNDKTGESGLFPAAYVVLEPGHANSERAPLPPPPAASASAPAPTPTAIAEYDYEKDEDNEVAFAEGDRIIDIEFVDDEWWLGKNETTGESGLFPANYVTLQ